MAAVSSFGIGGTNAHVIVERNAPPRPPHPPRPPAYRGAWCCPPPVRKHCVPTPPGSPTTFGPGPNSTNPYCATCRPAVLPAACGSRRRVRTPPPRCAGCARWPRGGIARHRRPGRPPDSRRGPHDAATRRGLDGGRRIDWPTGPAPAPWDFPPRPSRWRSTTSNGRPGPPRRGPCGSRRPTGCTSRTGSGYAARSPLPTPGGSAVPPSW
ncbi:hypothetical protein NKH18_42465 [Streptomyces sp. M10(2022)]